jgi:hypothetical protein
MEEASVRLVQSLERRALEVRRQTRKLGIVPGAQHSHLAVVLSCSI